MIKLIFLMFIFTFSSTYSQSDIEVKKKESILTDIEFQKAKDKFITMIASDTYNRKQKASDLIIQKINGEIPPELIDEKEWITWITKNLTETSFKNVDEAIELRELNLILTKQVFSENEELFELMSRASKQQIHEVTKPERLRRSSE